MKDPMPAELKAAVAALKEAVNAPAIRRLEGGDLCFFSGELRRRDPSSGAWLPMARS